MRSCDAVSGNAEISVPAHDVSGHNRTGGARQRGSVAVISIIDTERLSLIFLSTAIARVTERMGTPFTIGKNMQNAWLGRTTVLKRQHFQRRPLRTFEGAFKTAIDKRGMLSAKVNSTGRLNHLS